MARVKLSEYDAKKLLFPGQKVFFSSTSTTSGELKKYFGDIPLVVKVDQGIKKRGKQGLVKVNLDSKQIISQIRKWSDLGFSSFIVEPVIKHDSSDEKYLSFERTRSGWNILYSEKGGIDIESNWDQVTTKIPSSLYAKCQNLIVYLDKYHLATLELNPVIVKDNELIALDAACEIDDAALSLPEISSLNLLPVSDRAQSESEKAVMILDDSTPASLKFKLIHPEGRIWMFLSGGGASLVLADEVADLGMGEDLANYGEYSGAPTDDDVYAYAKIILKDLLYAKSNKPKAIIIAGGVANFTDVAKTFKGLIKALGEKQKELVQAGVKVYVRRGGPNEKRGLSMMEEFLKNSGLFGSVHGHEVELTKVVSEVKAFLKGHSK